MLIYIIYKTEDTRRVTFLEILASWGWWKPTMEDYAKRAC